MTLLRGALFYAWFYLSMAVCGALFFIPAAISPNLARRLAKVWLRMMFAALRVIGGVRVEVRGQIPVDRVVVAAKHQSMLDVFIIVNALPEARFVMKRELVRTPIFGWFALRLGTVPVDRGGGSAALVAMVDRMMSEARQSGQIVIYPQGTRTPPGRCVPYKSGVHALYAASGLPCVPAATNSGLFQPKGLRINPGVAVVEFLPTIPPGLHRDAFMARIEADIEKASRALDAEARR
ncbi:MAG: lysophospholipid acyltransferase family protein [Rubrimonas sp.]